ncbi:hypothetical protein [Burkholderia pseudomallei]|uniref:hypothetical protein n=1 Tax=Burkholderia pseudomallei TaxID=28450 RepID=UPI000A6B6BE0|nr:hypothetical protein [Burkholderia pseudomallei]
MNDQQQSRTDALTDDQRQALGESISEYFGKLDSDEGIRAPEGRILRAFDYCDSRNVDDLIDRAIVPALSISANETGAEGAKPIAWFIDWPDEPELGHYFAEEPCAPKYGRSRALGFIESRSPAMAAAATADERAKLERLRNGLENCIENAQLRNDAYDVGYMTEMLNSLKEVIARAAASPAAEAVAWVRKHPDTGELSGDWLWNDAIEQCRKDSGVWFPLGFLGARPALPEEPAAIHQVIHQVWVEETSSWADVTPAYYAERQPSNRRRVYYAPQPAQADAPAHATECPHCDGEGVIEADSGASPCACAQDAQEGMPTFGARRTQADAPAEAREPNQIYVEVRQCDRCDHIGINDGHATDAACGYPCGWSGPSPVEDKCPGCGHENVMSVACPKCSGHYSLLANGLFETNEVSEPAEAREPIAWVTDDDRAITAAQKQRALADGGATASSVRPYSIPCYAVSAAADAGEAVGSVTISKPGDSATGISFMSLNEHGRQTLGKGKHLLYTNAKSSTLTVGRQQTIGRAADTLEFHGLKTEATELRALLDSTQQEAKECACPNGDGSLRQPCPVHPPTQTSADLADDDKRDAERYRTHVKYEYETIYMPAVEKKGLRPLAFAEYKASADQVADAARTQESKS